MGEPSDGQLSHLALARARGLGSAQSGTEHFWAQRVTALANLVLLVFLIYSVIRLAGEPLDVVRAYFALAARRRPRLAVRGFVATYHMRLGMQVIIEDYIHKESFETGPADPEHLFCGRRSRLPVSLQSSS